MKAHKVKLFFVNKKNNKIMNLHLSKGQTKSLSIILWDMVADAQVPATINFQSAVSSDTGIVTATWNGSRVVFTGVDNGAATVTITAQCMYVNSLGDAADEVKSVTVDVTVETANATELRLV